MGKYKMVQTKRGTRVVPDEEQPPSRGCYIAIEGVDGVGKTTQAKVLADLLGAVLTRENGGTPVGQRIRSMTHDPYYDLDPWCQAYLFAADRAQLMRDVVKPALDGGRHVVSDRSVFSSVAYQGGGNQLGIEEVLRVNAPAMQGVWPDLVLVLHLPVEAAEDRVRARSNPEADRWAEQKREFYERVDQTFKALPNLYWPPGVIGWPTFARIDASGTVDEVAVAIMRAVQTCLKERADVPG